MSPVAHVNRSLTIEPNCEENILKFKLIFNDKKLFKIQYLPRVGSKIYEIASKKSHSLNPSSRAFEPYQEHDMGHHGLRDLKGTNKTKTRPSLIDIYLYDHEVVTQNFQKTI